MGILCDLQYVADIKSYSSSAAVRNQSDVYSPEKVYSVMALINAERYDIVREAIHRITTPCADPPWMFLCEPAVYGKGFILRLFMDVYNRYKSGNNFYNNTYAMRKHRNAAVAIRGTTVHAEFKPTIHAYCGHCDSKLNTYRTVSRKVKCLIIDVVSLLSANMFSQVDDRLITGKPVEPFGGLQSIMSGNLGLLRTVKASPIFRRSRDQNKVLCNEVRRHQLSQAERRVVLNDSDQDRKPNFS
ncbi:hypothetical protein HPB48_018528 [Haemaphysalis longicornis]|uniref:Uncharacterized protein n=1 Tax=Haemaphysalis longicornis TaxID=44386 RepID=A0A9J6FFZ3_HAELO|nr:hypothetical protein HPB48_018528 [Haemaphysalis longicornis]